MPHSPRRVSVPGEIPPSSSSLADTKHLLDICHVWGPVAVFALNLLQTLSYQTRCGFHRRARQRSRSLCKYLSRNFRFGPLARSHLELIFFFRFKPLLRVPCGGIPGRGAGPRVGAGLVSAEGVAVRVRSNPALGRASRAGHNMSRPRQHIPIAVTTQRKKYAEVRFPALPDAVSGPSRRASAAWKW